MPSLIPNDIDDPIAEQYRQQLEASGQDVRFISNRDLVKNLGDSIINSGRTNDDIVNTYGEGFLSSYLDEKNKPVDGQGLFGDAMASLRRQALGLGEVAMGGIGLAADAVPGELFDPIRDAAMRKAAQIGQSAAEGPQPTIDSYADVRFDKPMEVLRYGANLVGGALPSVAQAAASGGVGGLVGTAGKGLLKKKIRKELGDIAEEEVERLARKKAFKYGAAAGIGSSSAVMGTGEVYNEIYPYTQLDPEDPEYIDPDTARNVSFAGGALVAGLDFVSAGKLLNRMIGIGDQAAEQYLRRLIRNLPEGVFLEGTTEAAQEFIIMASKKYAQQKDTFELSGQEVEQLINAGIMGATGGSQFAMLSAIPGPKTNPREIDDADTPKLDMSQRPDTDSILGDRPGETLGFEVGQEVSEPYGVSGTIDSITNGMATVRSSKVDADGVESVKIKQVPVSHLAPVFEKQVIEDENKPDTPEKKIEEQVEKKKDEKKVTKAVVEPVKNDTFKVPKDDYVEEVGAKDYNGVSKIEKKDAREVYSALLPIMSDPKSGITKGQTYNMGSVLNRLLRDGKITEELYNKATANDNAALKVLRGSGILGDNYNWKKDTAYQDQLKEDEAKYREEKKASTRKKNIEKRGLKVDEGNPQVLKVSGSSDYYVVRDIVQDSKDPSEDGYVIVDQYSDFELKESVATNLYVDPSVLNKPIVKRESSLNKEGRAIGVETIERQNEIPTNADYTKGIKFMFFTPKSGRPLANAKEVKGDTLEDITRQIKSDGSLRKLIRDNPGYVKITHLDEQGQEVESDITLEGYELEGSLKIKIGNTELDLDSVPVEEIFTDKANGVDQINTLPEDLELDFVYFDDTLESQINNTGMDALSSDVVEFKGNKSGIAFSVFRKDDDSQGIPGGSFRIVSTKKNNSGISNYSVVTKKWKRMNEWGDGSYTLVGFVTADQNLGRDIDIYYENANALKDDLVRGGYVENTLGDDQLPMHVPKTHSEEYKGKKSKITKNLESKLKRARQRLRELAFERPGEDYQVIANQYINEDGKIDSELKEGEDQEHKDLMREILKDQEELAALTELELYMGSGDIAPKTFREQNARSLWKALNFKYPYYSELMDLLKNFQEYRDLKTKEKKGINFDKDEMSFTFSGQDASFAMLDNENVFGGKTAKQVTEEFHFDLDETRRGQFYKAVQPIITDRNFTANDVRNKIATRILDIYGEHKIYLSNTVIENVTPQIVDEARQSPQKFLQLFKYYLVEAGMSEAEAGHLIEQTYSIATRDQGRGAQLRSQGKEAQDREVLDSNSFFNPEDLFKSVPVYKMKAGLPAENRKRVKAIRDKKISGAITELEGRINNYRELFQEIFKPQGDEESNFASESFDIDDLKQISTMYDADGRYEFQAKVPQKPDLSTGIVEPTRKLPITPEDIEADAVLAAQSETAIIAPEQNPMEKGGYPELVTLAQGAIDRFVAEGDSKGTFSAKLALDKIIKDVNPDFINSDSLTFWASMLKGSNSLNDVRIRFMPWNEFRKYARVTQHGVTAGVYIPSSNEIIITDTFYNDPDKKISADEALANLLVHELTHVPVRLGMEVAYATSTNNRHTLNELSKLGLGIDNQGLVKIYQNVKDVIIPYLHKINKEYGVNPREYALTSVEEFFAELPSNYELRHLLKKARMTPELSRQLGMSSKNPFKTVWQYIRRIIARIIGVEPNLLDTADNYLKSIISKAQPMGKYMGQLPFDNKYRNQQMLFDFDSKVAEAPSDLPTFWGLYKIKKGNPKMYQQVAEAIFSPGNEYLDGDIAYQYAKKLGLDRKRLYTEIQRAHKRHWAKTSRRGYRYSQVQVPNPYGFQGDNKNFKRESWGPTNSEVSLDIIQAHRGRIFNDYLEAFAEDTEAEDVSNIINDTPQNRMDEESIELLDPGLKGLLRALEKEDWLGFDYPSGAIVALFDEDFFEQWDIQPSTKAAITRYVNQVPEAGDERYNQVEVPKSKFPNKEPDAGARVYHEANVAANNEIIMELRHVYMDHGETLPNRYKGEGGFKKFIKDFGLGDLAKRMNKYTEILGVDMEYLNNITIYDQGMNRRGRDRAMIDAVSYLSKIRERSRIQKAKIGDTIDRAKADLAAFSRLHERMQSGKLIAPAELAQSLTDKIKDLTVPQMQKILSTMEGGADVTVEDLKNFREDVSLKTKIAGAMDAVIEMSDSVETMKEADIIDRIKGSLDSRLKFLKEDKFALHAFANKTRGSVDLYAMLRIAKDSDSDRKKSFMRTVAKIAGAKKAKDVKDAYNESFKKNRLGTQLKNLRDAKLKALEIEKNYGENLAEKGMHEAIDGLLLAKETRLRTALGELEPIDIRHGVNMKVMRRKRDEQGNTIKSGPVHEQWELDDYLIRYKGGKLDDRDGFVKANVETLEFLRDEKAREAFSHEPWYDIMREQANRAMHEPVGDQYFTIRKQAWMAGIESLNARLNRLGYEGKKLAGMLSRTSALFRDINSDVQYYAKRWNVAYLNLMDKLGMSGQKMFTSFYQDLWWWMDQHPEFDGNEEDAVNAAWSHLKEYANVPDKSKLNAETKKAMVNLLRRTLDARNFEADYNFDKLGNRIKDDFKVQSLINGEMVDFYRRPVELGYATIPRVMNEAAISDAMFLMKKDTKEGQGQFNGQWVPSKSSEDSAFKQLKAAYQAEELDIDSMRDGMSKLFTDEVVEKWANNYLKSDARKSQFYGPDKFEIGSSFVNAMWYEAKRNASGTEAFFNFLDSIYDHYRNNGLIVEEVYDQKEKAFVETETVSREDWYFDMANQFQGKFDHMHKAFKEILKQKDGPGVQNMLMNSPRSLDSRQLAATLPKEYFYYDSYDEVTSAVRLQMMIATSVFGRGGQNANALRARASERYEANRELFLSLLSTATGEAHKALQSDYNKETRKKVYQQIRNNSHILNGRTAEQTFEDLFADGSAFGEMEVVFDHLNKYYGSGNVAGPFRDANLPLELLGLQSISVLNNPKSSFWQGLSLTEFPMAFHGMNGMALKATGKGFMTFIDQTFGGILEAMGMNIGNTHRYAQYLANTHFRNSEADLTYKEYTSQVGAGGELSGFGMNSMGAKRGVRFMKKMMMHNRKDKKKGLRSPIDWTTPLIGLFPYINSNINHGAGVGAIFAVESEVLKIAKVIEDQGLQNFHNFTAEELGLGKGGFEFFIGEKDGFNQMNNLLEGNGLSNLSRLAFDFVQRKKQDPNTPVIEKDTGLLINQLAMNEVTGEGFNAKPAVLYTNPFWKYFGIFMGWPLWKMARDNRVLQGNSNYVFGKDARTDRATWMAFLKYLSMVSAVYAPAGLAFAMLVDWYDDEVLEKPNNLPPISPWAALPVLGPFMAAQNDPNFSIYAITSRLAKAGVPYGMGIDLANSVFSKGDPYGSSKEFSLDSRIFAWSMIKNVYDAMGNWMHQGEIDYQNVTRPIMYGLGGNSVIQFMDATTAMFDLDTTERRMADYIGSRNIIKKYAWGMGLDLRPPGKGYGRPTATSINVRQMERAAYNFDTMAFREAYQEAIEAAREAGEQNPEKAVRDKFKRRLILYNITDGKITDQQLERMFELMEDDERELIQRYLRAHEQYLRMIEVQKPLTKTQQNAYLFSQGVTGLPTQYRRRDPRLIALGLE